MDYEELKEWIKKKTGTENYQPVIIKILNRNSGEATREKILEELHNANQDLPETKRFRSTFARLEKYNVVELRVQASDLKDDLYVLSAFKTYGDNPNKVGTITWYCDEKIGVSEELATLRGLGNKVNKTQLQVLEEIFKQLRGKDRTAEQLGWSSGGSGLQTSPRIDEPFFFHTLASGTYTPAGSKYAQAIALSPKSKWGNEIDRTEKTLKINWKYDDPPVTQHKTDMKKMSACYEDGVPIGLFFKLQESKYRCLGLGQIKSIDGNNFVITPFGITEDQSQKLKDDVLSDYARYYARAHKQPAFTNHLPIKWDDFSSELDKQDEQKVLKESEVSPDKKSISSILEEANEASWVLPEFQRTFEWKQKDVVDLLDSIFKDYYIGSFLIWNVEDSTKEQIETHVIEGIKDKEKDYDRIVLDGQQRITSLNYAINSPEKSEIASNHPGYFYFDLSGYFKNDVDNVIVHNPKELEDVDTFDRLLFPVKYLLNPDDWLEGLEDFLKEQNVWSDELSKQLIRPIRNKASKVRNFLIPIIELKGIPYAAVSKIFENLNTRGKPLKGFALLNNRLVPQGVALNKLWDDTLNKYPKIKTWNEKFKEGKIPQYILESISLSHTTSKSCRNADILDMYHDNLENEDPDKIWTPEKFNEMWDDISDNTNRAIEKLENKQTGFGVQSADALPYESMLPVLTSLIQRVRREYKDKGEKRYAEKIRKWFWSSIFHERYNQGVQGVKKSDYTAMIQWFEHDEETPKFITDFERDYQRIEFKVVTRSRSAIYRGILCLIMKHGASDPRFSFYDESEKPAQDHIFPKSKMKSPFTHSILNMTWLTDITNSSKNNKMPKKYYTEIRKNLYDDDDSKLIKELSSHLIDNDAYYHLMDDNFSEFIESRNKVFLKAIADEIGIEYKDVLDYPTRMTPQTEYGNLAMLMNALQGCKKEFLWCSLYFEIGDLTLIYGLRASLNVKKIRLLTSMKKVDKNLKSLFEHFRDELRNLHDIECEMRVMSKEVADEQHARYLKDPNHCWEMVDRSSAARGTSGHVLPLPKEQWPDFEKWWDDSYDIFVDWTKKIVPLVEEYKKKVEGYKKKDEGGEKDANQ